MPRDIEGVVNDRKHKSRSRSLPDVLMPDALFDGKDAEVSFLDRCNRRLRKKGGTPPGGQFVRGGGQRDPVPHGGVRSLTESRTANDPDAAVAESHACSALVQVLSSCEECCKALARRSNR